MDTTTCPARFSYIARDRPDLVRALHHLELAIQLVDGQPEAVRSYLRHFWSHWSGPGYEPAADHLSHLVSAYGPPGAFAASIAVAAAVTR